MVEPLGILRTIAGEFSRFFARNFGTFVFCLMLGLLLFGYVGGGMGIPGLFQNPDWMAQSWIISTQFPSPAFFTAFFLYYLSFVVFIIVRFWEAHWRADILKLEPGNDPEKRSAYGRRLRDRYTQRKLIWNTRRSFLPFLKQSFDYALNFRRPIWLFSFLVLCWVFNPDAPRVFVFDMIWVPRIQVLDLILGFSAGLVFTFLMVAISLALSNAYLSVRNWDSSNRKHAEQAFYTDGFAQMLVAFLTYVVLTAANSELPVNVYIFLLLTFLYLLANLVWLWWKIAGPVMISLVAFVALIPQPEFYFPGIIDKDAKDHYVNSLSIGEKAVNLVTAGRQELPHTHPAPSEFGHEQAFAHSPAGYGQTHSHREPHYECTHPSNDRELVMPTVALQNWMQNRKQRKTFRRKLVIVSTSGGAYPAAYWTAMVLDEMQRQSDTWRRTSQVTHLADFTDHIRLITGASGGMVGGAYFAALAPVPAQIDKLKANNYRSVESRMDSDVFSSLSEAVPEDKQKALFPRDSLTKVARKLIRNDLPARLMLIEGESDRGRELEKQWQLLNQSNFGDLVHGERMGWRPSVIFSPMISETGKPLLISNLHLSGMEQFKGSEAHIFFDLFPCSQNRFTLATAVRMNATFPYISPAVALPTNPPLHVVDAGYYDNYGIATAASYLSDRKVRNWIKREIDDVIIIEIRAFPTGAAGEVTCGGGDAQNLTADDKSQMIRDFDRKFVGEEWYDGNTNGVPDFEERFNVERELFTFFERWRRQFDRDKSLTAQFMSKFAWLTNPVASAISARSGTMHVRNAQALTKIRQIYAGHTEIHNIVFVNDSKPSLNWYLEGSEIEKMRACFQNQWAKNYQTLVNIWKS